MIKRMLTIWLFTLSLVLSAATSFFSAAVAGETCIDINQLRYTQEKAYIEFVFDVSNAVNPILYERKKEDFYTIAVRIKNAKNHIALTNTYKKKTWLMDVAIVEKDAYVEYQFSAKKKYKYRHRYLPTSKQDNKGNRYVLEIYSPAVKDYTIGFKETLPSKRLHAEKSESRKLELTKSKTQKINSKKVKQTSEVAKSKSTTVSQVRKIIVAIDPGHGGKDPGAIGQGGTYEKHIVLNIAKKVFAELKAHKGFEPKLIRAKDEFVSLTERRKIAAKTYDADLFLSIHADAAENKTAKGASVYILSTQGASSASARYLAQMHNKVEELNADVEDDLLALLADITVEGTVEHSHYAGEAILKELKKLVPLHKNTVEHAGFAVLKNSKMVSLLVETGFISNKSEERKLKKTSHQDNLARAIVKGLVSYYEKYPEPNTYFAAKQQGYVYLVKAGDNLSIIANRYNVSIKTLKNYNDLSKDTIYVGQKLKIPL